MLFTVEGHLDKISKGLKTQTRRENTKNQDGSPRWRMTPGKEYRATQDYYTPTWQAIIIRCKRRWLEPVRNISAEDAKAEGGYTVEQYQDLWLDKYGVMDDDVQCYEFEFVRDNRPLIVYVCNRCGCIFKSKLKIKKNDNFCKDCLREFHGGC